MLKNVRRTYILAVAVIGLLSLSLYSTYAMFTANVNLADITLSTDLEYTFKLNQVQQFQVSPKSKIRFNAKVVNEMNGELSYGLYYKVINQENLPAGAKVAEVTVDDTKKATGKVSSSNPVTVPIAIVNNSETEITIEIGVAMGYSTDTMTPNEIIYETGQIPITDTITSEEAGNESCSVTDNCSYTCYTVGDIVHCGNICNEEIRVKVNVNAPNLVEGLIPVMYKDSKWVKADESNSTSEYQWYDYDNKQWANAVLVNNTNRDTYKSVAAGTEINASDILAYYVWIPRYKYKVWNINKTVGQSSINGYNPEETGIDIVFEKGTSSTGDIECTYSFTTNTEDKPNETCTGSDGQYYTHPAFTFGNKELTGIWVGKFEVSGTTNNIKILPGVSSLSYTKLSSFWDAIHNMTNTNNAYGLSDTESDSHLMKNMEWGAVAYLTHSKYGRCTGGDNSTCTEVTINSDKNYTTGGGRNNAYVTNVDQSTTGNIYGIYDMSGGAYEYVMGNVSKSSEKYEYNASFAGNFFTYDEANAKYLDTYAYGTTYYDQTAYNRARLGDATGEVVKEAKISGGWYSNRSGFVNSSGSWFRRGGRYGDSPGVFYFYSDGGNGGVTYSARGVLAPLA